ncbi:DUF4007 family protein [Nonomuraea dietziae]|uniref:DUF4007 family protein n=1 Tax=Nonomuraea dietziae TaxID=65515 RepID=UPI0033C41585
MFARHSDLPPRYGWLGKAYTVLSEDPLAFAAEDACLRLGVRRAALTAIRYWTSPSTWPTSVPTKAPAGRAPCC